MQVTVDPQEPLGEVSGLFSLTEDQDTALVIIGQALLKSFADIKNGPTPDELNKLRKAHQRTLFLHGPAESGKSFVIRAWIALAESWNHSLEVRTCAATGIAAVSVEGVTIASLYNGNSVSREKQLGFLGCHEKSSLKSMPAALTSETTAAMLGRIHSQKKESGLVAEDEEAAKAEFKRVSAN